MTIEPYVYAHYKLLHTTPVMHYRKGISMEDLVPNQDAPPLISDADIKSFTSLVIEASMERPVLVDFWADWCGPCKQLTPMLKKAVTQASGKVALVMVNADTNQAICGQLRIQSLPTVMAFWQGQPIDGFQGALAESQLNEFIQKVLTTANAEAVNPVEEMLKAADELLVAGNIEGAVAGYNQALQTDNSSTHAIIGLGEIAMTMDDTAQASEIIANIPEDAKLDPALKERLTKLKATIAMRESAGEASDKAPLLERIEANAQDFEARFELAKAYQGEGDMAGAAEALLAILMRDMSWNEDAARKELLTMFEAAGATDPFTLKYRRRLSSLMFS